MDLDKNSLKALVGKLPFGRRPPEPAEVIPAQPEGLGTFGGVFTPSILTILGVIMYLRFGWVVGQVGLVSTLIIVTLATSITLLTSLSISAIATDQRVRIGGAYYMISRSLGIESGGAIGIPLYLAQALSVALYTVGFAESVVQVFPSLDQRVVGIITTILVAVLALRSAAAAIRIQYFIMGAIVLSLISLFFGQPIEPTTVEVWGGQAEQTEGFWVVFALFFPAVTGIMAGVNMSGDLREPSKSIPRGTLAAVGVGYLIYMGLPILLASRADASTLIADPLIMRKMSWWGDAILLGVWGATLSSALGSILGAPRVLQALARDRVLPKPLSFLGRGSGPQDEPRIGTLVTLAIALTAVGLGNLDIIAPVLTMFFLTTYGVLNVAAGVERFLGSPSFRPRFKVHWSLSLIGALGCVAVMFLINALATIAAATIVVIIFIWLERRELETAWGDVRRGIWMAVTRAGLMRLGGSSPDPKNWRPHLLVLSGVPTRRWHLIEFASSISHNRAFLTLCTILSEDSVSTERQKKMEVTLREYLDKRGVQALLRLIRAPDAFSGAERLVDAYGLGPLIPNTILLGVSDDREKVDRYCQMIGRFHEAKRNVAIIQDNHERGFGERRRIDVWWGGLKRNGGLMIILSYMLQTSLDWRGSEVKIKMVTDSEDAAQGVRKNLDKILLSLRTGATGEVIVSNGRSFPSILRESSQNTDLIFLGMREPDEDYPSYYEHLRAQIAGLPTTVLILAAENMEFGEILLQPE